MEPDGKIIFMGKAKRFTLNEARTLLPKIREITERFMKDTTPVIEELQAVELVESERAILSKDLNEKVDGWVTEVTRLGAVAKGLWLVDFDSGSGYYCWKYPEEDITFFHSYDDGFSGRLPIQ